MQLVECPLSSPDGFQVVEGIGKAHPTQTRRAQMPLHVLAGMSSHSSHTVHYSSGGELVFSG